jgi:hypothetical protein
MRHHTVATMLLPIGLLHESNPLVFLPSVLNQHQQFKFSEKSQFVRISCLGSRVAQVKSSMMLSTEK